MNSALMWSAIGEPLSWQMIVELVIYSLIMAFIGGVVGYHFARSRTLTWAYRDLCERLDRKP